MFLCVLESIHDYIIIKFITVRYYFCKSKSFFIHIKKTKIE